MQCCEPGGLVESENQPAFLWREFLSRNCCIAEWFLLLLKRSFLDESYNCLASRATEVGYLCSNGVRYPVQLLFFSNPGFAARTSQSLRTFQCQCPAHTSPREKRDSNNKLSDPGRHVRRCASPLIFYLHTFQAFYYPAVARSTRPSSQSLLLISHFAILCNAVATPGGPFEHDVGVG